MTTEISFTKWSEFMALTNVVRVMPDNFDTLLEVESHDIFRDVHVGSTITLIHNGNINDYRLDMVTFTVDLDKKVEIRTLFVISHDDLVSGTAWLEEIIRSEDVPVGVVVRDSMEAIS